ncbi:hypothetical protein Cni_G03459 [Canna indica]|uniref:GIR1-like zinc ribbon domain-containing protein n=1 Tax=Canna indica TaxID=4628 RepID=A0AAQ3JTI0_9LILI|nr:hypothetical protein Cni_G03459 [Canna indica]
MATQVSYLAQMLRGYDEDGNGERQELVTRDLLGGGAAAVDLELQVPAGWERRLDLSSGKTYLQKSDQNPAPGPLNDLNLPPPPPPPTSAAEYRSVCTLEKVKSALQRQSRLFPQPDGSSSPPSPSPSSSSSATAAASTTSTSSSVKRAAGATTAPEEGSAATMAVAACPVCLLYVLISEDEPRCPRCAAHVPVNQLKQKKPRIDLNFSLHTSNGDLC